jgi:hypothetical protein
VTLISVHNSEGCTGRCDARCYDATHPDCDCVCGGSNHGKGEAHAIRNTALHADRWMREYRERTGGGSVRFEIGEILEQLKLWQ